MKKYRNSDLIAKRFISTSTC